MSEIATLSDADAETNRLLAIARRGVATYDLRRDYSGADTNDEGDTVRTVQTDDPTAENGEINLTTLYRPAVSRTGNVDLLVIEAELVAEGRGGGNPHIPIDPETREAARDRIESEGLTPAWEDSNA